MGGLCVNGTLQVPRPGEVLELLSNAAPDFCFIWAPESDREKTIEMRQERERQGKNMSQYKGCTKLKCPVLGDQ
jgi:hypothetical protein